MLKSIFVLQIPVSVLLCILCVCIYLSMFFLLHFPSLTHVWIDFIQNKVCWIHPCFLCLTSFNLLDMFLRYTSVFCQIDIHFDIESHKISETVQIIVHHIFYFLPCFFPLKINLFFTNVNRQQHIN